MWGISSISSPWFWPTLKSRAHIIRKTCAVSLRLIWASVFYHCSRYCLLAKGVRAKDWFSKFVDTKTKVSHSNGIRTWKEVHKAKIWRQLNPQQMQGYRCFFPGPAATWTADLYRSCQLSVIQGFRLVSRYEFLLYHLSWDLK